MNFKWLLLPVFLMGTIRLSEAQHSVARRWNEVLLDAIRFDPPRPTVHARNLFHSAVVMYDAWAAYDEIAEPFLLGKTIGSYSCSFDGVPVPADIASAQDQAISFAAYRLLIHRFNNSPGAAISLDWENSLR